MATRTPSSSTTGFIQELPKLPNQFHEDESLQRVLHFYLPGSVAESISPALSEFGDAVLTKQIFSWISDAERNVPYLRGDGFDAFGRQQSELVTSEGWRQLQDMGLREGIVAAGYEHKYGRNRRLVQFLKYHLWSSSSAVVCCPSAMQDGAAAVLTDFLNGDPHRVDAEVRPVLQAALSHLTSRDPAHAWTSGQWMTERTGGSDVSGTETVAMYDAALESGFSSLPEYSPGPWRLDGFKWFSSATDCSMAVALAQSPKGLSCFYAPTRKAPPVDGRTDMNGIRIQRLKKKLGTRALPTAELELKGMRAWLLGAEGEGVKVISRMLNITRLHNAVSSISFLGRGLAISRAYSRVRKIGSQRSLREIPLFAKTLSTVTIGYRANMLLTYFVAYLLGLTEPSKDSKLGSAEQLEPIAPSSKQDAALLLRVLTPIMKARTAKESIHGLQESMESLGGVGYLENDESQEINISRLYRDCNVLSIWEGTTDVMATDAVKTLTSRDSARIIDAIENWLANASQTKTSSTLCKLPEIKRDVANKWSRLRSRLSGRSRDELLADARSIIASLGDIVCATLLLVDAERDMDETSLVVCQRFAQLRIGTDPAPSKGWEDEFRWDKRIAFGSTGSDQHSAGVSKL